jgi:alpha-tubulin suppressor-like RCC1 family protein
VWCWGGNRNGRLGDGTSIPQLVPGAVQQLGGAAAALVAGQYHTCARMDDGAVRCWGSNNFGPLGDGSGSDQTRPVTVPLPDAAVSLASVANHGCAALAGGDLWCWGYNGDGAVDRSLTNQPRPVRVAALGTSVRGVMTGDHHTCALLEGATPGPVTAVTADATAPCAEGSQTTSCSPSVGRPPPAPVRSVDASARGPSWTTMATP